MVLAYDLIALLVETGSCLGLWLGLSVVGVFDILVIVASQVKKLIKYVNEHYNTVPEGHKFKP